MRQLREAVRHDEGESVTFFGLRQRSEKIDCQKFEGSGCQEYSKGVRSFLEVHAVLRTDHTVADRFVYIGCHLWPIVRSVDVSVYASRSGVAGRYRMMGEVEYKGSERIR